MSAPTSKGKQILEAMKTRWDAITTTGINYNYSYAGKVKVSPASPELEGVYINPADDAIDDFESSGTLQDITMNVNVDIVSVNNNTDPFLVEVDILKSTGQDITWGGLAYKTKHTGSVKQPVDQSGNLICSRRINLEVTYRKTAFNK